MLKSSESTAELNLNRLLRRLLLPLLDGNKREAGRLYKVNIRLSKISFSPIGVRRKLIIGILIVTFIIYLV